MTKANSIQNDLNIIAGSTNELGFREDDYGNDPLTATNIIINGLSFSVKGLINTPGDIDVFKFKINSSANLKLNAIPQNVGWGNAGADIDIKITLLDAQSNTIGVYNPELLLNVGIDTSLNTGDYYIMIAGTGNMNHSAYGSLGIYNIVANLEIALPIHQFILKASSDNGNHVLSWTYTADEKLKDVIIEASPDGRNFHQLVTLNAAARFFSYNTFDNYSYYRLKAVTEGNERAYYSNLCKIMPAHVKAVQLMSNIGHENILCIAKGLYTYQLFDTGGRILIKGTLINGMNTVDIRTAPNGILMLHISNGIDNWTERLIKQ